MGLKYVDKLGFGLSDGGQIVTPGVEAYSIEIDLSEAQRTAEKAREMLLSIQTTYDLSRWEYTKSVRIAPLEMSHSHPVLTLNSLYARDDASDVFLCVYLHEQVHWALDLHRDCQTNNAIDAFRAHYPKAHSGPPATAADDYSTYLHLVVNYLEIEAATEYLGQERAEELALNYPFYRWMYRTVVEERDYVKGVLEDTGVLPLPIATWHTGHDR